MNNITDIRPSPLAGRWYPAQSDKLAESVDRYIQSAEIPDIQGEVIALISPHAGHIYSGPVAGYGFKTIKDINPDLILILSPYHAYHSGAVLTTGHQAFQTPLGVVPIDQEVLDHIDKKLSDKASINLSRVRDDEEHSVEILLPFFQRAFSSPFKMAPIMFRSHDQRQVKAIGEILAELLNEYNILLAASTDLSHFYPSEVARNMDQEIINKIINLDPAGLFTVQEQGKGSACGLAAVAAVLWASLEIGKVKAHHLHYAHSGDITGDNSRVVGYTSAVIVREGNL
jgi:AmmeMemoRadiSam system protein B